MTTGERIDQTIELKGERVYLLSSEEKKIVDERRWEMESGVGIPHEEVCEKVEQWFRKPKPLTLEQLKDTETSEQQFAAGLAIPHEEVMKKFLIPPD